MRHKNAFYLAALLLLTKISNRINIRGLYYTSQTRKLSPWEDVRVYKHLVEGIPRATARAKKRFENKNLKHDFYNLDRDSCSRAYVRNYKLPSYLSALLFEGNLSNLKVTFKQRIEKWISSRSLWLTLLGNWRRDEIDFTRSLERKRSVHRNKWCSHCVERHKCESVFLSPRQVRSWYFHRTCNKPRLYIYIYIYIHTYMHTLLYLYRLS